MQRHIYSDETGKFDRQVADSMQSEKSTLSDTCEYFGLLQLLHWHHAVCIMLIARYTW